MSWGMARAEAEVKEEAKEEGKRVVESASRQRRQRKSMSQSHTTHTANAILDGNRDLFLLPAAQRVDRASAPHTTPPRPARAPLRRITRG